MRNSNRPFIPANDYNEINSLCLCAGINDRFDLHIITQPHSEEGGGEGRPIFINY